MVLLGTPIIWGELFRTPQDNSPTQEAQAMEETADSHNSDSGQSGLEDDSSEYFMSVFGAPYT